MAGQICWKNDYIIQIDEIPVKVEVPEADLHQPLEGCRGVGQSKGHSITFIKAKQPYSKHTQWLALLIHPDLPEPRLQVELEEPLGSLQTIEGLINVG